MAAQPDALRGAAASVGADAGLSRPIIFARRARSVAPIGVLLLSWLIPIAFLAWAARLVLLEGYVYEISGNFVGDFTRTAALGATVYWDGQGLFYGPIFVLESKFLVGPHILSFGDFARLDFVLFGIAFVCVWLAIFGAHRPRLAIFVLAAWLANHMTVEAFSNTAHLEVLELALIAIALLLATRGFLFAAGGAVGLAMATKVLPGVFVPYLVMKRQWRMLAGVLVFAGVPFFVACWVQGVSVWDGLYSLVYQGGNLTKLDFSEYEYAPRAEIARTLAGDAGTLSAEQAQLAIVGHLAIALVALVFTAWVLHKVRLSASNYALVFALIAALVLIVAPSAHAPYYVFLLPAWTAILGGLLQLRLSGRVVGVWVGLGAAYTCVGFDQPFFLSQRLLGFGTTVPQHWLAWHLPTLGLLLTISLLSLLLLSPRLAASATRLEGRSGQGQAPATGPVR